VRGHCERSAAISFNRLYLIDRHVASLLAMTIKSVAPPKKLAGDICKNKSLSSRIIHRHLCPSYVKDPGSLITLIQHMGARCSQ